MKFLIKPVEALNNSVTCFVTYLALWFWLSMTSCILFHVVVEGLIVFLLHSEKTVYGGDFHKALYLEIFFSIKKNVIILGLNVVMLTSRELISTELWRCCSSLVSCVINKVTISSNIEGSVLVVMKITNETY